MSAGEATLNFAPYCTPQAYSLHNGRPVSDADFEPRRSRYENTGQLQLLHRTYQYGTPNTNAPQRQNTQEVNIQDLTQQLKIPLYKQLIGNTAMVDLSSLSANPQVDCQHMVQLIFCYYGTHAAWFCCLLKMCHCRATIHFSSTAFLPRMTWQQAGNSTFYNPAHVAAPYRWSAFHLSMIVLDL